MPTVDGILDALKFERMVGIKSRSCFGSLDLPPMCDRYVATGRETTGSAEAPRRHTVRYERFEDPRTGEPLYRPLE